MAGIDHVGQKVECIAEIELQISSAATFFLPINCSKIKVPVPGDVYTVAGFEDCLTADGSIPGIHLNELPSINCKCVMGDKVKAWPMLAFRPVDERKTDISVFTEILKKAPAPKVLEPEDAFLDTSWWC